MTTSERVEVLRIAADLAMAAVRSQSSHSLLAALTRQSTAKGVSGKDDLSMLVTHYFDHLTDLLRETGEGA